MSLISSENYQLFVLCEAKKFLTQTQFISANIKYVQQNGPIPILDLAVRYKKLPLVKQLTPLSNAQSRKKALNAAWQLAPKK